MSGGARPRVLQVVSHLALGGAERVALTLMEGLRAEFEFSVFAVRGVAEGEIGRALAAEVKALGVALHTGRRVPMRYGGVLTGAWDLRRAVKEVGPDLIHLHTEIPEASWAALASVWPGLRKIPVVRTVHNTVFWAFAPGLGRWCDRRLARAAVAGVSAPATEAFLRLRAESGAGASELEPVTILNGVKPPKTKRTRAAWRPGAGPLRVVFGGRLEPQKGTDLLPEILRRVELPVDVAVELDIFGSGAHEALLRQLAAEAPRGWRVTVRGPVADFAERLVEYDVAIMPSRFEGLGLVAVEALLAGTLVLATDVAGLREVFPENYPWLAEAGDAGAFARRWSEVLRCPEKWPEETEAARGFAAKKFGVTAMASGYAGLYRAAMEKLRRD